MLQTFVWLGHNLPLPPPPPPLFQTSVKFYESGLSLLALGISPLNLVNLLIERRSFQPCRWLFAEWTKFWAFEKECVERTFTYLSVKSLWLLLSKSHQRRGKTEMCVCSETNTGRWEYLFRPSFSELAKTKWNWLNGKESDAIVIEI